MCMMVYIASDVPLPTSEWDEAHPAFYVQQLAPDQEIVRQQFSKKYVYYAGSHEGCGCGFGCGDEEPLDADVPPDVVASSRAYREQHLESRRRLAHYLAEALKLQDTVEVFTCWAGDEGAEPEYRDSCTPSELTISRLSFREKELLRMVRG